jgi:hypothetical protein
MKPYHHSLYLLTLCCAMFASDGRAQSQPVVPVDMPTSYWTTSLGFDYTTGKYGQSTSTNIFSVPFSIRCEWDRWTFQGTVPYIQVSGPAGVVQDIGLIFRGRPRPTSRTESGIGDVVLSAGFALINEDDTQNLPHIDLTGKIKLGTADSDKGLGTGENDYSMQLDAYKAFGDFTPFATLGYRVMGDPPGTDFRNILFGSAGASFRLVQSTTIGASLDWRQEIVRGGEAATELSAFITHRLDRSWKVQGYVLTGLTDASPDFGFGGIVSYAF